MASISEKFYNCDPQPSTSREYSDSVAGQLPQKKRTRRKPRHKDNKKIVNEVGEAETSYDFTITTLKNVRCVYYKKRSQTLAPINSVYLRRSHRHETLHEKNINLITIESNLNNLTINDSNSKPHTQKKENKVKWDVKTFQPYLSEKKVTAGLEAGILFKGFIRINPNNPNDAYVGHEDASKYDYQIGSIVDRNRALDGDYVVIKEKNGNSDKKLMEVVHILEKVRLMDGRL